MTSSEPSNVSSNEIFLYSSDFTCSIIFSGSFGVVKIWINGINNSAYTSLRSSRNFSSIERNFCILFWINKPTREPEPNIANDRAKIISQISNKITLRFKCRCYLFSIFPILYGSVLLCKQKWPTRTITIWFHPTSFSKNFLKS